MSCNSGLHDRTNTPGCGITLLVAKDCSNNGSNETADDLGRKSGDKSSPLSLLHLHFSLLHRDGRSCGGKASKSDGDQSKLHLDGGAGLA